MSISPVLFRPLFLLHNPAHRASITQATAACCNYHHLVPLASIHTSPRGIVPMAWAFLAPSAPAPCSSSRPRSRAVPTPTMSLQGQSVHHLSPCQPSRPVSAWIMAYHMGEGRGVRVHATSTSPDADISELMDNLASDAQGLSQGEEATCVKVTLRKVPGDTAELLSDALLGSGATSVVVVEHRAPGSPEQEIYEEPGSGTAEVWDVCDLLAYYPLEQDPGPSIQESVEVVGLSLEDLGDMAVEPVANTQWVDQIKASYIPLQLSPRMYIVPEWSEPTAPDALNIIMQPGVAFGTGEHPTTRMCLMALEAMQNNLKDAHIMDYGTGSGVLALAALLLGASSAVGTDTDPLAVRSALRNADLTGVGGGRFSAFVCGPHSSDPEPLKQAGHPRLLFDVVAANILRGPLLELQPRLTEYCRPLSTLLLSGILAEQVPEVKAAYEPYFENFTVHTDSSWACVVATRRQY